MLRPSRDESQSGHPGALSNHDRAEKPPVIKPSDCFLRRHSLKEAAFSLVQTQCVFPGDCTAGMQRMDGTQTKGTWRHEFVGNTNGLETVTERTPITNM